MSELRDVAEAQTEALRELTMFEWSERFREALGYQEREARVFVSLLKDTKEELHDKWEMIAQAMLALRHIEDARMRFGKVIQYADNGQSIYKK